jgi:hypothetical protein
VLAQVGKQQAKLLARLAPFAALKMVPGLHVNLVGAPAWLGRMLLQRGASAGGAGLLLGSCRDQVGQQADQHRAGVVKKVHKTSWWRFKLANDLSNT